MDNQALTPDDRWDALYELQDTYIDFRDFLYEVMVATIPGSPSPTDMQFDIAHFLQTGGHDLMVQAQRGEAKTTITSAFAVWSLIHDPTFRVVIFSAGGKMAKKITMGIIQIIYTMPELACLRPSTSHKDGMRQRAGSESFDVHWSLKGPDKQESVSCMGITAAMEGNRADLLIADDIESKKNSMTETMRENLNYLIKDFASICGSGRVIYLGTPQSQDSIYNQLEGQGFVVRIWTGRVPTEQQLGNYGDNLAPFVRAIYDDFPELRNGYGALGDQGAPTDPLMKSEETLQSIERKQGEAYFQLQHMLNTALADAERFPLKLRNLLVMALQNDKGPTSLDWGPRPDLVVPFSSGLQLNEKVYRPAKIAEDFAPYTHIIMAIDPAGGGQNADETAFCILAHLNGYMFILAIGGVPGGVDEDKMKPLANLAKHFCVNEVYIEKNFGYGAYASVFSGILREVGYPCNIEEVFVTGQKELRIIETLEPVMGRRRLVLNEEALTEDIKSIAKYDLGVRQSYSLIWQIARLTRDKRALRHDDRVDVLHLAVSRMVELAGCNPDEAIEAAQAAAYAEFLQNPTGLPHYIMNGYDPSIVNHPSTQGDSGFGGRLKGMGNVRRR